jgi:hypothetical protein
VQSHGTVPPWYEAYLLTIVDEPGTPGYKKTWSRASKALLNENQLNLSNQVKKKASEPYNGKDMKGCKRDQVDELLKEKNRTELDHRFVWKRAWIKLNKQSAANGWGQKTGSMKVIVKRVLRPVVSQVTAMPQPGSFQGQFGHIVDLANPRPVPRQPAYVGHDKAQSFGPQSPGMIEAVSGRPPHGPPHGPPPGHDPRTSSPQAQGQGGPAPRPPPGQQYPHHPPAAPQPPPPPPHARHEPPAMMEIFPDDRSPRGHMDFNAEMMGEKKSKKDGQKDGKGKEPKQARQDFPAEIHHSKDQYDGGWPSDGKGKDHKEPKQARQDFPAEIHHSKDQYDGGWPSDGKGKNHKEPKQARQDFPEEIHRSKDQYDGGWPSDKGKDHKGPKQARQDYPEEIHHSKDQYDGGWPSDKGKDHKGPKQARQDFPDEIHHPKDQYDGGWPSDGKGKNHQEPKQVRPEEIHHSKEHYDGRWPSDGKGKNHKGPKQARQDFPEEIHHSKDKYDCSWPSDGSWSDESSSVFDDVVMLSPISSVSGNTSEYQGKRRDSHRERPDERAFREHRRRSPPPPSPKGRTSPNGGYNMVPDTTARELPGAGRRSSAHCERHAEHRAGLQLVAPSRPVYHEPRRAFEVGSLRRIVAHEPESYPFDLRPPARVLDLEYGDELGRRLSDMTIGEFMESKAYEAARKREERQQEERLTIIRRRRLEQDRAQLEQDRAFLEAKERPRHDPYHDRSDRSRLGGYTGR